MSQRRNRARTDGEKVAERGRGEKEGVSDRWCRGRGGTEEEGGQDRTLEKTEAVNKKPRIESRCEK